MCKSIVSVSTVLLMLVVFTSATVKTIKIDKSQSVIIYHMIHPMHSWDGANKSIDGLIQYSDSSKHIMKVAILAKVADFNSGNSNRDSHMIEVTEALKYPNISFVSNDIIYDGKIMVKGNLIFHGVAKPIQFYITENTAGNRKTVEGDFEFKLTDYKIDPPSLMFVKTEDKVKVTFTIQFTI